MKTVRGILSTLLVSATAIAILVTLGLVMAWLQLTALRFWGASI